MATFAIVPEPGPAPTIAVVSRSESDPVMVAALNRFRGEATAVGFIVTPVKVPVGVSPASEMEIARTVPAVATVAFVHGDDPNGLDVWFMDRQDGHTVVDHVAVESLVAASSDDRALVVAVKAVDVLRARLYGLLARSGRAPDSVEHATPVPAPAPVVTRAAPPPATEPSRSDDRDDRWERPLALGLSLGVGALHSVKGLGTSLLLLLRGAYDITSRSALRVTFGGLGTRTTLDAPPAGSARVRETLLMLEWALSPWGRRVRPLFVMSAGAHYFMAQGIPTDPFQARDVNRLVGAAGLALGAHAFLSRHFALCLEAGALLLFPPVEVKGAGNNARSTGQPTLLATLTLETRL